MRYHLLRLLTHSFIRGGMLFTVATFLSGFLHYLFNSIAGKTLGPAHFGEIITLGSYLVILTVPLHAITTDIVRRLGKSGEDSISKLKRWEGWMWYKISSWRWLFFPYLGLFFLLPGLTNLSKISAVALLLMALFSFPGAFYLASFQGLHRFSIYSIMLITLGIVKLLGPVLTVLHIGSLSTILLFLTLSGATPILMGRLFFSRMVPKPAKVVIPQNIGLTKIFMNKTMAMTLLSLLSITILINLDVIFIKKFFMPYEAGLYGAWNLFAKIVFYVLSPIISLSLIFFSNAQQASRHVKVLLGLLLVLAISGGAMYFAYALLGRFVVLMIFSNQYLSVAPLLPQAAIFGLLFSNIFILNNYFLAKSSAFSLIAVLGAFPYSIALFVFGSSVDSVIRINIISSAVITLVYLLAFFYYNRALWLRNTPTTSSV